MLLLKSLLLKVALNPLLALLLACGWLLFSSRKGPNRASRRVVLLVLVAVYVVSIAPVSGFLLHSLELGCPAVTPTSDIDIVVVPGAGVGRAGPDGVAALSRESSARLLAGIRVFRETRASRLVVAGGSPAGDRPTEASVMAREALALGVPAEQLVVEAKSRNTWEHVLELRALNLPAGSRLALVTSAMHMRRAMYVFGSAYSSIVPVPVGCTERSGFSLVGLVPSVGDLGQSVAASYEGAGLVWYLVRRLWSAS